MERLVTFSKKKCILVETFHKGECYQLNFMPDEESDSQIIEVQKLDKELSLENNCEVFSFWTRVRYVSKPLDYNHINQFVISKILEMLNE